MRKIFTLIGTLACIFGASAADFESNGLYYNILTTQAVAVTYTTSGYSGDIEIPQTVTNDGTTYTVTQIGVNAFAGTDIASVTIPAKVNKIGNGAFNGCKSLTKVVVNSPYIADGACNSTAYTPSKNLVTIFGEQVTDYIFNENVGKYALYGATNVENLAVGENVTAIGDSAFWNLGKVASFTIPASVKTMGPQRLGQERMDFAIYSSAVLSNEEYPLIEMINASRIHKLTIDVDTVYIPQVGYYYLDYIDEMVLGPSVKVVKTVNALRFVYHLVIGPNVEDMTAAEFRYYDGIKRSTDISSVSFQNESLTRKMFGEKSFAVVFTQKLEKVAFVEGVKSIGDDFLSRGSYSSGIKEIKLPSTLESIGDYAFADNSELTDVTIPESVKTIGEGAFKGTAIDHAEINSEIVPAYAFSGCKRLRCLVLGDGVKEVKADAFSGDASLVYLEVMSSVEKFGAQKDFGENLRCMKDLSETADIMDIQKYCFVITNSESKAEVYYRRKGFPNVFSMESLKYQKEDVNWDSELNTQDVMEVYEAIKKQ